jgi:hypothetical protein
MSNGLVKDHDSPDGNSDDSFDDICHDLVPACPLGFSAPSVVCCLFVCSGGWDGP